MKLEADVRSLIADLQATLAGSSEGRGVEGHAGTSLSNGTHGIPLQSAALAVTGADEAPSPAAGIKPGRPSLEPTGCDHACRPKCPVCARRLRMTDRAAKKAWLRRTYGPAPDGEDVFRGFR